MKKTKAVFLDAHTLNPGDNDLGSLSNFLDIDIYPRTKYEDTVDRAQHAEIIITNKAWVDNRVIEALPSLRMIQVAATGYNNVDTDFARSKGVDVCNISGYSTSSVAQHVFAMLLEHLNSCSMYFNEVREGAWSDCEDFSYWHNPIHELCGKTIGIIGFGKIGEAVARIASSFGMNVIVSIRSEKSSRIENLSFQDQDYVFKHSDVISLHAPLNDSTRFLINSKRLAMMKKHAILINTARGDMVNEADLAIALEQGSISAALLDVLSTEPPSKDNILIGLDNCKISPHQAWASLQSRQRLLELMILNIRSYLDGSLLNCVNA